jgi:succinoglycan biosynthesis transport protein ExoP
MRPLATQLNKNGSIGTKTTAVGESDSGLSLGDIFQMITSHWLFILLCVVVCVAISYLYARSLTSIYEASGSLRLDPGRAGSLGLAASSSAMFIDDSSAMDTEIAIIQSDSVATETLNRLTDDEFKRFAGGPRSQLTFQADAVKLTPAQEALLGKLKSGLKARQIPSTQLMSVSFRSPDPQLAATIVNDAMAAYLKQSFDSRYGSISQVKSWLSLQMNDLRNQSIGSQDKLTQFQEKNNILVTGQGTNTTLDALKTISDKSDQGTRGSTRARGSTPCCHERRSASHQFDLSVANDDNTSE